MDWIRRCALILAAMAAPSLSAQRTFTLQQVLSAPYSSELTGAPAGHRFAWVENAEGRRNLWVSDGKPGDARAVTHYAADDGQDIADLAWSPDASAIAYTYGAELGADEKPANPAHLQRPTPLQVVVQPLAPGAVPRTVGDGEAPLFTRDARAILFVRNKQIWIADDTAGATPRQLVYDRGEASHLTLSPDGKLLAFVSTRGRGQREHSYIALYDLAAHTLTFPAASTDSDSAPAFSRDGTQLAWIRSPFVTAPEFAMNRTSATPWSIQLLDLATGKARAVFDPRPNLPGSVLAHMSTGAAKLWWTAKGGIIFPSEADGWVRLYELQPTQPDEQPQLLTPGSGEVEDVALSGDGSVLVFATNRAGTDPLDTDRRHLWRVAVDRPGATAAPVTGGSDIEAHPQLSSDGRTMVALQSTGRAPAEPVLIEPKGRHEPLHANAIPAEYPLTGVSAPHQVLFRSADKQLILHGQIFFPSNFNPAVRHPAIVFVHGGPHRQMLLGYPQMDYYSNAYAMNEYLSSRGFIVLSVNYRCGIGYGLEFRQCEHSGADGGLEYNDVLGAASYLRSCDFVDAKRLGIWGGSYGGYLTAMALARNSDLFAAGVDFHGVHEWAREDNATADWLRGSLAEQEAIAARAHASSPMAEIDHWRSPVLLIHGDNDPDVAYAQTPTLADALRARNVPVEELIFPDEVHGFILHRDWLRSYQAAADFFSRTLHPER